ncbi:hypothetical protein ALC57_04803 [Trachymyrmex cornetzi]|uniref:Uncharacterized protein n=1 Tax=Trachymyrmex cornetzi TaxID=471704 RepID=A0A195EDU8_9HYME|nr:hypothetical protein ALC57_04803 [Trachymyrmex cornetzi]
MTTTTTTTTTTTDSYTGARKFADRCGCVDCCLP